VLELDFLKRRDQTSDSWALAPQKCVLGELTALPQTP